MNEKYLTVAEVATMLDVSEDTVRRMFANEPGVINLGHEQEPGSRRYRILRIPRRVLNRVIDERAVGGNAGAARQGIGAMETEPPA
jgi:predicted DNA-binding transcriptional regulator YafY